MSDEPNQNIDAAPTNGDTEDQFYEPQMDEISYERSDDDLFDQEVHDVNEEISNTNDIEYHSEEEQIESTEAKVDPLFIDQPTLNPNIDIHEAEEGIDEEQNVILIPGLPEGYKGGRPAHGQLVCDICGHIAKQMCRLIAHMDSHSTEKSTNASGSIQMETFAIKNIKSRKN